LWCATVKSTN
jgi:hypothetical protein